ncbi:MAG: putative DNA binding domain-containing protein [Bacteroidales bacterium]|jgi:ATP-dependent DNA helicase RecG|nr:putative DNA binding domain-containing protein [Bacteroidales bacterium]MCI2121912.1 putative DNA binding domain-containing protein [Bacteroidales bacterium]MCI2146205.1 putative DNA binding domain-containing protein [Bacteroidales bacterium]
METKQSSDESQNIEYKEQWHDEYLKWICGFANASGGKIYIGINDNKEVVGVDNSHKLMEDIPNKIVNYLGIVADINLLHEKGLDYLEIVVQPSNIPISHKGIYYFRSGATKQELKGVALQQFILKKMGRSWDDIANETATLDDIDRDAIDYFLRKATDAQRMPLESLNDSTEKVLENLNLYDENGKLKNAAILLFGKRPSRFFTCVEFKIGRFGKDESDLMFQDVVEGNIIQMTDRVIEILKSKYLISPIYYKGLQRIEPLEIPEDALREALFNSIIHKDYTGVFIQLKVYADRLILWNEGKLPDGYTVDMLMNNHSSKPRNRNIANVFYKAGFIEAWGRGINKIRLGLKAAKLPEPVFESTMGGFSVTIYRKNKSDDGVNDGVNDDVNDGVNDGVKLPDTEFQILHLIVKTPSITYTETANKLKISEATVTRAIRNLRTQKYIIRKGSDKVGSWIITEKGQQQLEK